MWLLWRVPEWCSRTDYGSRVWCGNKNKNGYQCGAYFFYQTGGRAEKLHLLMIITTEDCLIFSKGKIVI